MRMRRGRAEPEMAPGEMAIAATPGAWAAAGYRKGSMRRAHRAYLDLGVGQELERKHL